MGRPVVFGQVGRRVGRWVDEFIDLLLQKGPLRGLCRTIHLCTILGLLCTVFGHIQDLKNFALGPHDFFRGRHPGGSRGESMQKIVGIGRVVFSNTAHNRRESFFY